MQARIWGCRGSLATPGESTARYGGNTSCVEVRTPTGHVVVLDGGTGIRLLGNALEESAREIDVLLTHFHLDHVEGLGFFAPFFRAGTTIRFWGPRPGELSLADEVARYLSPPLFPLPFDRFDATVEFHEVSSETWSLDGLTITAAPVEHPGATVGYRLEHDGVSLAYIPDNELGRAPDAGADLAEGVDVLLHDAQYTDEEYASRHGWGHSTTADLAAFVERTRPARAVMFHHDPLHDAAQLEEMLAAAQARVADVPVELAAEGVAYELGAL